jgi:hypothetical protein
MHLITEDEARKLLFSAEARPSPTQFARLRREYDLPCLRLGRRVLFWDDELKDQLKSLDRPKPE